MGIRILADESLYLTYNRTAEHLLCHFQLLMDQEFPTYVSMAVHMIKHLPEDAKNFGAIDTFSCYRFENCLKSLKQLITSPKQPLKTVTERLKMRASFRCAKSRKLAPGQLGVRKRADIENQPSHGIYEIFNQLNLKYYRLSNQPKDRYFVAKINDEKKGRERRKIFQFVQVLKYNDGKLKIEANPQTTRPRSIYDPFKVPGVQKHIDSTDFGVYEISRFKTDEIDQIDLTDIEFKLVPRFMADGKFVFYRFLNASM